MEIKQFYDEFLAHASYAILSENKRQSDNLAIYPDNSKIVSEHPEFEFTPIAEGILKTYLFIKKNKALPLC